jgi:sulfatase maturation enzyme AslB (radical SAM superfamily)
MTHNRAMKTLCPLPWLSLSTESQRELRLCCHESREERSGTKLDEVGSLHDAFDLDLFKGAREKMLAGSYPKSCEGCFKLEAQSGQSPRLEYLERFKDEFKPLLANTLKDGSLESPKLVYLDVTTDNHCNLKCRMCRPRYSQKILEDWKKLGWNPGEDETKDISLEASIELYQNSDILKESFADLRMITLTGGEPFLSPAVSALLEEVIKSGHSKKISLRFFSNTTVYPEALEKYLENFESIHLFCSFDGFGKTSDYIRFPSNWENIDKVYKKFLNLLGTYSNLKVDVHTVVQAYNITQLIDLFDYLASFNGLVPLLPSFTHVDSSLPLSTACLPIPLLIKARENFENFLDVNEKLINNNFQAFHDREIENYRAIIKEAIDFNKSSQFIDFVVYAKKLDKIRNQSLEKQYPEFKLGKGKKA